MKSLPGYTSIQPTVERFDRFPVGAPKATRPDMVMTCPVCRRPNTFVYAKDLTQAQYERVATAAREKRTIPKTRLTHRCVCQWRTA